MDDYRIVLADDHTLVRQGIRKIIEESEDMAVVGEASDGLEVLNLLKKTSPDLVILDLSMPNLRGIEATSEIKMVSPDVEILILTVHKNTEYLHHALAAGARGYLLKDNTDVELLSAIDTIRQGGVYLSSLLTEELAHNLISIRNSSGKPPEQPLTARERMVLKLVADAKSSEEIATLLSISARTVQNHRANMMKKLNLRRTADLVKYAIRHGYISETE